MKVVPVQQIKEIPSTGSSQQIRVALKRYQDQKVSSSSCSPRGNTSPTKHKIHEELLEHPWRSQWVEQFPSPKIGGSKKKGTHTHTKIKRNIFLDERAESW